MELPRGLARGSPRREPHLRRARRLTDLTSAPVPDLRPDDHVRGDPGAPLVLFYGDFACPRCGLARERLKDEPLRIVFRHFALRAKHPRAVALAAAAEAAALQGAFWEFHDALYDDQGRVDDPHLWQRCERLGLDVARFEADRRSDAVAERVRRDVTDALRAGATATPTLFTSDPGACAIMVRFGYRQKLDPRSPTEGRATEGTHTYE